MSVVAAKLYRDGKVDAEFARLDVLPAMLGPDDLLWIGLHEPDERELAVLQARLALHPLAVEDALKAGQLPKVDIYPAHLFIVSSTAHDDGQDICYGEAHAFVGRNFLVTVRHGGDRAYHNVRASIERVPALLAKGPDYVVHRVLDYIVDGYLPVIERVETDILAVEDRALDSFLTKADITCLYGHRRELIGFERRIEPMAEMVRRLATVELPDIDADARPYFRDVEDHIRRVLSRVRELRDIVASVVETSGLLEAQRQGATTRQLAAWAAILALPTAIAGIYGMNFDFMPELRWRYGYFAVLGVIAASCGWLYARFKKAGWI